MGGGHGGVPAGVERRGERAASEAHPERTGLRRGRRGIPLQTGSTAQAPDETPLVEEPACEVPRGGHESVP